MFIKFFSYKTIICSSRTLRTSGLLFSFISFFLSSSPSPFHWFLACLHPRFLPPFYPPSHLFSFLPSPSLPQHLRWQLGSVLHFPSDWQIALGFLSNSNPSSHWNEMDFWKVVSFPIIVPFLSSLGGPQSRTKMKERATKWKLRSYLLKF